MVVIVAAGLSFAAITLKPHQDRNVEIEKKQNILSSVHLGLDANKQPNKAKYIESLYDKHITEAFLVDSKGNRVDGNAFTIDIKKETAKPLEKRKLPVFVCAMNDSLKNYILPVYGRGLWGPVWGYVALKDDYNTIVGVIFDHKSETPGLGAEINTPHFQKQFDNKKLFDNDKFVSVRVVKNQSTADNPHAVDAISGGTITSDGVDAMLSDCLIGYQEFFKSQKKNDHEQ
jgi:Na+-transporting NADH:ubiquinone oxidoreductase subunit C